MDRSLTRWIFLNLLCVAFGTAMSMACMGTTLQPTALFVLVIVWLSNEVWNLALFGAAMVNAGWQWVKTRTAKRTLPQRIFTLTSVLLLLVPHVLFAILYAANELWGNQLAEAFHLPLTHGFFACTYAAVVLLWILALRGAVVPLSLEGLIITLMEPELDLRRSDSEVEQRAQGGSHAQQVQPSSGCTLVTELIPGEAEKDHPGLASGKPGEEMPASEAEWLSRGWSPLCPKLKELLPDCLYYARPNLTVTHVHVRQNRNLGLVLAILVVPFLLALAYALLHQYPLAAIVPGVLALAFGWVAWKLLSMPRLWREKLKRAEFAITKTQVLIAEGHELRSFDVDSGLRMMYEEVDGDIATILFDHVRLHKNPVMKFLVKIGMVDDSNNALLEPGPLQGFYQIDNAAHVYMLLKKLGVKG